MRTPHDIDIAGPVDTDIATSAIATVPNKSIALEHSMTTAARSGIVSHDVVRSKIFPAVSEVCNRQTGLVHDASMPR